MRIGILVFPGVQLLDLVGPMDVFHEAARQVGNAGAYTFEIISITTDPIQGSNGMHFLPDATLQSASEDIDTLLIAGHPSLRDLQMDADLAAWVLKKSAQVRRIGSVCTGAFVLAAAGLLNGKRATTHWNAGGKLASRYPDILVQPDHIYIQDGKTYTSAGVTAGMDLALAMVEEDLGRPLALRVARELVMFLKRPGGQSQFSAHLAAQTTERSRIRDVQDWALENLAEDLSVDRLAQHAGMSSRNFARMFKRDAECTPAEFVEGARLDAVRRMLEETATPLKRIASLCGFGDANTLRRAFIRRLGVSPVDYRRRFPAAR